MKFKVNDTLFEGPIDLNETIKIKSYSHDYFVNYQNISLNEIIKTNYNDKDYIIIDKNVYNIDNTCLNNIDKDYVFYLDAIEQKKTIDTVLEIIDKLFLLKFNKNNKILVIGGGITQDISGMVCAMYKRGLKWTFVPTTILSMTDSAIGGKIGINRNSKNMLALFVAPYNIIISNYFFDTLKEEDKISGLGESLKLALTGGKDCVDIFKENFESKNYINIIKMSSAVKKLVIEYDELEKNERRVLNYGHTIGHAIETASDYFIPHGIAVLYGMYLINTLFYDDKYKEINNYILQMIPIKFKNLTIDYDKVLNIILNDKKNKGTKVCFILLENYGESIFIFKEIDEFKDKLKIIFNDIFV